MADTPDLSKLRIDRKLAPIRRSRRGRWITLGVIAALALALAGDLASRPKVVDVQKTAVNTTYP